MDPADAVKMTFVARLKHLSCEEHLGNCANFLLANQALHKAWWSTGNAVIAAFTGTRVATWCQHRIGFLFMADFASRLCRFLRR